MASAHHKIRCRFVKSKVSCINHPSVSQYLQASDFVCFGAKDETRSLLHKCSTIELHPSSKVVSQLLLGFLSLLRVPRSTYRIGEGWEQSSFLLILLRVND